jgi:hypothetical protein
VSQDPVLWETGITNDGKRTLLDPQLQNSYSYARNNPVLHKDPEGRIIPLVALAIAALSAYDTYDTYQTVTSSDQPLASKSLAVATWVSPLGEIKALGKVANSSVDAYKKYSQSRPAYKAGQVESVWNQAKNANGVVKDPNTNQIINWLPGQNRRGVWDMGHRPGQEYNLLLQKLQKGEITEQQFLQHYRNPQNYQPELPSNNRSRKYEQR